MIIDCGLSVKQLKARSEAVGADAAALNAIVLSHDHGDHIGGVARLMRAVSPLFYSHHHVASRFADPAWGLATREFADRTDFRVDALGFTSIRLPHDARGTCGFIVEHEGRRLAHLTDLGYVPAHLPELLADVELLSIEANHDAAMLEAGPYPLPLKKRILSNAGHLSNDQCADLVARVASMGRLRHVVLAHLSETNNTPELARRAVRRALDGAGRPDVKISLGSQRTPSAVFTLG